MVSVLQKEVKTLQATYKRACRDAETVGLATAGGCTVSRALIT
jgi:hypothetical protein